MATPAVMLAFTIPAVAARGGRRASRRKGFAVIVSANKPGVNGPALPARTTRGGGIYQGTVGADGAMYQWPRAIQSCRWGRSAPMVVSGP